MRLTLASRYRQCASLVVISADDHIVKGREPDRDMGVDNLTFV
jgi:hypothetical protein